MSCFGVSVVDSVYDDVSECLVDENTPIQEESCHRFWMFDSMKNSALQQLG